MKFRVFLFLLMLTGPAFAGPEAGRWLTEADRSDARLLIEIKSCDDEVCGFIVDKLDANGAAIADFPHRGRKMIWDVTLLADGTYSEGTVWGPPINKNLTLKMSLEGDVLTVKGCFAGGWVCRGQDWTRVQNTTEVKTSP